MVSVIIPTHNRKALLARAMESVLGQKDVEIELIVVDDASTDGTEELFAGNADPRVRYERFAQNRGACAARNRGIELARGEYIAFQDSDDIWSADKCARQMQVLREQGADVVFCAFEQIGMDGKRMRVFPEPRVRNAWISFERLLAQSMASTQTILGRAECFRDIRFAEEFPRLQDYELMLRMARKYKVYYHADVLVTMYEQPDSISRNPAKLLWALRRIFAMYGPQIRRDEIALRRMLENIRVAAGMCGENVWQMYFAEIAPGTRARLKMHLLLQGAKERARIPYRKLKKLLKR